MYFKIRELKIPMGIDGIVYCLNFKFYFDKKQFESSILYIHTVLSRLQTQWSISYLRLYGTLKMYLDFRVDDITKEIIKYMLFLRFKCNTTAWNGWNMNNWEKCVQ